MNEESLEKYEGIIDENGLVDYDSLLDVIQKKKELEREVERMRGILGDIIAIDQWGGDGKDLGHVLEFKSEVQLSYAASDNMSLGVSYNHVSNASLGDKNPGANSYMFNFLKKF